MIDDKNLVIFALLILGIFVIFNNIPESNSALLNNIVSGMLGMATGAFKGGK